MATPFARKLLWFVFIWCLVFFPISAVQRQPAVRPSIKKIAITRPARNQIMIAAVGDVMMPLSIQSSISRNKKGYDGLFEKISKDFAGADITFANLETPVDHKSPVSGYPKFNAHPALLAALKKAGVTIVSVANNHAMDAGSEGLKRTLDNIESSGLVFIGAGRTKKESAEIKFFKVRDLSVAFLSYTYDTNWRVPRAAAAPGVNIIENDSESGLIRASERVKQARAHADLVVVSVHWGDEYAAKPTKWQRRVATALIEAGADVILGHHPHVLQPVESIATPDGRVGLVAFSLGNFISSQNAGIFFANKNNQKALRGDGIILNIAAVKEGRSTRVAHAEFLPIWTLRESIGKNVIYRPVSLVREIDSIKIKADRKQEEERMLTLLTYRYDIITKTIMAHTSRQ